MTRPQLYDALHVDPWSIGVLLVFCLAGATPFTSPVTMAQATEQWEAFKKSRPAVFSAQMAPVTDILNLVFVPSEQRIRATDLTVKLGPPLAMSELQSTASRRRSSESSSKAQRVKSSDGPGSKRRSSTGSVQSNPGGKSAKSNASSRRSNSTESKGGKHTTKK